MTGLKRFFAPKPAPVPAVAVPIPSEGQLNLEWFLDEVRKSFGYLTFEQEQGFKVILEVWVETKLNDLRWLSYLLATAWHETGQKMKPIYERGTGKDVNKDGFDDYFDKYDQRVSLGNTPAFDGDGELFRGRGFVQITGRRNYRLYGIENDPDRALDPKFAAHILIDGSVKGLFTGKALDDYFNDKVNNPVKARAVINGSDRADMIAGYHNKFLVCLVKAIKTPAYVEKPVEPVEKGTLPWVEVIRTHINAGVGEIPGSKDHPIIVAAHKLAGLTAGDTTAWCSSYMKYVFFLAGVPGSLLTGVKAWARDWMNWGVKLDKFIPGCVMVFERNAPGGDSHVTVGLYEEMQAGRAGYMCSGGNQDNKVNVKWYPKASLLAMRWPTQAMIEAMDKHLQETKK